jgi:hypothetical protein
LLLSGVANLGPLSAPQKPQIGRLDNAKWP